MIDTIQRFAGLNRTAVGRPGEFIIAENLSMEEYPCISPRRSRQEIGIAPGIREIQAFIPPGGDDEDIGGFTGVADGVFYYRNVPAEPKSADMQPLTGQVSLADFNGKIIIAPYLYYYDYTLSPEDENYGKLLPGAKGFSAAQSVRVYSEINQVTEEITSRIVSDSIVWEEYFSVGDALTLWGFTGNLEKNNTCAIDSCFDKAESGRPVSVIADRLDGGTMYVRMCDRLGATVAFMDGDQPVSGRTVSISVKTALPELNSICVHNNRLWGTNPNGEFIYASKPGDPFNFHTFEGLSSDSWYGEIGTRGGFLGILPFRDTLVAMKRDYLHHIYGDKPSNYAVPKQLEHCGCADIRSAAVIGTALYYLGDRGFYRYSGGQPELIDRNLHKKYISGTAATDGVRYYCMAKTADGGTEFLVYDTDYGVWVTEDSFGMTGGGLYRGSLYCTGTDCMYRMNAGDQRVVWLAETVDLVGDTMDEEGVFDLFLRVCLFPGAEISVYTVDDAGESHWWSERKLEGSYVFRVPVRMRMNQRIRLGIMGKGKALIYGIERHGDKGGRRGYPQRP